MLDILFFLIIFIVLYIGFTFAAYMSFGGMLHDFRSIAYTMYTLFIILLGAWDFSELLASNRVMGPIFMFTFVFFCFFILLVH